MAAIATAKDLTLEFEGLCAYVRGPNNPGEPERLTVLLLDAAKAGMTGHPMHAPEMKYSPAAIQAADKKAAGSDEKATGNDESTLDLSGCGVRIQTTRQAKLDFAAEFQMVPSLETIRSGYGRADETCMRDTGPREVVAARIAMTGGTVTAKSEGTFSDKQWRFEPPPAPAQQPRVLADTVCVTVAGENGPFSIVLTDLKTGAVRQKLDINPAVAAKIEFRNVPEDSATTAPADQAADHDAHGDHTHNGSDKNKAAHFAICYEVSKEGKGLAQEARPIPVLATAAAATTGQAAYPASSATVFCPGAALYFP